MVRHLLMLVVALFAAHCAHAQIVQQQTVQLPTFHYFGVQTTVVVPTRGTIPLGSVTRAGQMSTQYGWGGRSFNMVRESAGLSMGATVIDNAEIDRQLLAEAARRRGAKVDVLGRPVAEIEENSALEPIRPPMNRPREQGGGAVYLRRGRDAERAGQPELAKVFYRRAAKVGNAFEKREAGERLAVLGGGAKR